MFTWKNNHLINDKVKSSGDLVFRVSSTCDIFHIVNLFGTLDHPFLIYNPENDEFNPQNIIHLLLLSSPTDEIFL